MEDRFADRSYLKECLELARTARGSTSPNPMVGAVVVRDGEVVGRGYHRCPGDLHAERLALQDAGDVARGATLYVNIEPCSHQGRTPPCVDAVLEAGIVRVVVSTADPDPRVSGGGFEALCAAGVTVEVGELAAESARLNEAYLTYKTHGRPFVVGKAALSLDGRLATKHRSSQWITGEAARERAHQLRATSDAVMVGIGTVLADDPRLTARHGGGDGPRFRVVLDSKLRTPPDAKLLTQDDGRVLILTRSAAPDVAQAQLESVGAEVVRVGDWPDGGVAWPDVLQTLADREVMSLLLEGGSGLLTSAFEADIIDKLFLIYAPLLIGGAAALPLWGGDGIGELRAAPRLREVKRFDLGDDWVVEGYLHTPEPPR